MNPSLDPPASKPASLHSVLKDAHLRIDYLVRICTELTVEAEPDRRRHLQDLLEVVTRHGMNVEGSDDV